MAHAEPAERQDSPNNDGPPRRRICAGWEPGNPLLWRGRGLTRKSSFAPIVSPATCVLVLGSLPGEASLAAGRYYAHPRNRFWELIGGVIGVAVEPLGYQARLEALLAAGVGLWDTIASARRPGSLDAAIREHRPNALADLADTLPALRAVGLNGAAAARIGTEALGGRSLALIPLPSSSPAYAAMPLAEKRQRWMALRDFL